VKLTILGCGATTGVPMIAAGWGNCDPNNPKNHRLRSSILVEDDDTVILVDTSPDIRQQLLAANVTRLDAVLYTHSHADHCHGIDDLRAINRAMNAPIPAYTDKTTFSDLKQRFGYVFEPMAEGAKTIYKPLLTEHEITHGETFEINKTQIRAFDQDHGFSQTLGFIFQNGKSTIAYSTDLTELAEPSFELLEEAGGLDLWIIGTLVNNPHPTHAHVDKALSWIDRIKPKRAILTHMSVALDYAELSSMLPKSVEAAYDGMVLVS
jgi:phosphoribosyl 1,2-cyclic phosphate phosphodiesterase